MANRNRKTLYQLCGDRLHGLLRFGQSKKLHKDNGEPLGIYSWETFKTYKRQARYFCDWLLEQGIKLRDLEAARPYVDEWLQSQIDRGLSPYTIKTAASAMAKVYGCTVRDFTPTPSRSRANIKRSRQAAARDAGFSEEQNAELIEFCRSTGLRRAELAAVRGSWLYQTKDEDTGAVQWWLDLSQTKATKGGKPRQVPIMGDVELVYRLCKQAGDERVWPKVHAHADIHSYRADYCKRVYLAHARDVAKLPRSERYHCQRDKAGTVYDRAAMIIASKALGHNRESVIAANYLYGLAAE